MRRILSIACLLLVTVCVLGFLANAQAPLGPVVSAPASLTLHKSAYALNGYALLPISAASSVGVKTLSETSDFGSIVAQAHGAPSISAHLYVFPHYAADGVHVLRAVATDTRGNSVERDTNVDIEE